MDGWILSCIFVLGSLHTIYAEDSYTGFVDYVTITAQADGTHNGMPAHYKDKGMNLTVNLHLNESWVNSSISAELEVYVKIPNYTGIVGETCEGENVDGSSHGCTSSTDPVYDYYFMVDISTVSTNVSGNIQMAPGYPRVTLEDEYGVKIDFGGVSLTSTTDSSDIDIMIKDVYYLKRRSVQTSYTFVAEVEWEADNGASETLNDTVDTTLIGPDIVAVYTQSYSDGTGSVQAGDTVDCTLTLAHSSYSTEQANDLNVRLAFDTTQSAVVGGAGEYGLSPPGLMTNISQSDLVAGAITVNLATSVELVIEYTLSIKDEILLNVGFETAAYVTYALQTDSSRTFELDRNFATEAKLITFQTEADDTTLPANLAVGEIHPIKKSFLMPLGTLYMDIFADINTGRGLTVNPLTFTSARLTSTDPNVEIQSGRRRKKRYLLRKKRATDNVNFNVGTVVNPSATGTSNAPVTFDMNTVVGDVDQGGSIAVDMGFDLSLGRIFLSSTTGTLFKPVLKINQTVEYVDTSVLPTKLRFNMTVTHEGSNTDAASVELSSGSRDQQIFWYERGDNEGPKPSDPELSVVDDVLWTWSLNTLAQTDDMFMSYPSSPTDALKHGYTNFTATVTWKASSGSGVTFTESAHVCLERLDILTSTLITQWGFTVLALLFGLIVGALIVFLILYLIIRVCKKMPLTSVRPASAVDEQKIKEAGEGHGLLLTAPKKKGFNTIKDLSGVGEEESIVGVLAKRDRLKINRDLDTWDILNTINIDTEIENERDDAMMNATLVLMRNMEGNGDVDKNVVDKATQKFRKSLSDLNRKMDDDYKREIDEIYKRLSAKNQERLADLLAKQQDDEEDLKEQVKDLPPNEQDYLMGLLKEQHETEKSELSYRLKLEQDEETEKLRKEFSIRKRIGIKDAQQTLLDEVKTQGKMGPEQAEWLMKEHFKNQAAIEKIYDDEISRQRMALEDKLARRRALAQEHDQQEEFQSEALNTIAGQQMGTISKMRKEGIINEEEARALMEQAEKDMLAQKNKMDKDRAKQEQELHKKLSERKKKRKAEVVKKHTQELKDLEKKHQAQTKDGFCDPISALEEKQGLISHQRAEMNDVENELDKEHAHELLELRDQLATETRNNLLNGKVQTFDKLKAHGASEAQIDKLLKKHEGELARLQDHQIEEKHKQEEHFKKQLAKRRQQFAMRREEEKREQEQLREHEDNVVRKLMDNQVAMSEDERERIMAEHEKQMVKLENSLTLNKLQQKRMLEEKLAQKRARQLEKLQKKQNTEAKKIMRKADRDSDMDEQDKYHTEMDLLRKHAEQRVAVMQGENIQLEDELEEIRVEMMKERASSLKEQEVRLGAMMAQLQMEKAKEMAKIEEQQKAIHNLKSNLMDDLNDKGILSDPECQRVIEVHQREQEKLNEKLESQRAKQERAMRARLEQRLQQKEQQMSQLQDEQLREAIGKANTPAAKIRRVAMKQKHLLEMEKFRNRMEKEIEQTLQEMRRQSELKRMTMIQDQELQFINGLVRLGKFNVDELQNVVRLLFPNKSEEETKKLFDILCEGYEPRASSRPDEIDLNSSLVHRVKSASIRRGSAALTAEQMAARNKKKSKASRGRAFSPDQPPPNRLAPIKKKKKVARPSKNSEDELYEY